MTEKNNKTIFHSDKFSDPFLDVDIHFLLRLSMIVLWQTGHTSNSHTDFFHIYLNLNKIIFRCGYLFLRTSIKSIERDRKSLSPFKTYKYFCENKAWPVAWQNSEGSLTSTTTITNILLRPQGTGNMALSSMTSPNIYRIIKVAQCSTVDAMGLEMLQEKLTKSVINVGTNEKSKRHSTQ